MSHPIYLYISIFLSLSLYLSFSSLSPSLSTHSSSVNSKLQIAYSLDVSGCDEPSSSLILILAIVVPTVVVLIVAAVLIAIFVPAVRKRVFPYRDRKEYRLY